MTHSIRATLGLLTAVVATAALLACSPANDTPNDSGTTSEGAGGEGAPGSSGAAGATSSGAPASNPSAGSSSGSASSSGTGTQGLISVSQNFVQSIALTETTYNVAGSFWKSVPDTTGCVITTAGLCATIVCPATLGTDAGVVLLQPLNAGDITVTGTGDAGPAVLHYGPIADAGHVGYTAVKGTAQFFNGGDMVTATGAGGADLPPFASQAIVAPNDIALTSPACDKLRQCPDLDRTVDLIVTWTGGGAGKVVAAIYGAEAEVLCRFGAAGGTGTVPSALLSKLGPGGASETFVPVNELSLSVGSTATTFTVQGTAAGGLSTVK